MKPRLPASIQVIERGWLSSNNILGFAPDGTAALIDSGYAGQAAQTVAAVGAALAGRRLVRLARLINTHSHSDHIGGNAAVQKAFGGEILIPVGIEQHVAAWNEEALLLSTARQYADRFRHDGVIRPGDRFDFGGIEWEALAAPGHDMDALVFHCPEQRILISGDALWEDGFGVVFAELLGQGDGLRATRETLERIAGLAVDVVIPGHGAVFGDVPAALERARRRLAAFAEHPARMAKNAIKACFTFNLLDLERLPCAELESYVTSVPLFVEVGQRLLDMDGARLARWLREELLKAGAIVERDGFILPTMAA